MRVFKFGGASVKDADAIKKVAAIIKSHEGQSLLVVISAMGKTTNALENLIKLHDAGRSHSQDLENLIGYHTAIVRDLFDNPHPLIRELDEVKIQIEIALNMVPSNSDLIYDQVVSLGEILSTKIVSAYFNEIGISTLWADARKLILTDDCYREAKIDWGKSNEQINALAEIINEKIVVTQGFIGSEKNGYSTTLGREGSDFSAAIFASCLNAESVTIWKDVPGVMSADPKRLPTATVFDELPFKEAAEMTYYGASVIHPKTIKPLANKGIPLFVKNFDNVRLPGTLIHECKVDKLPPLIVFKDQQCLVSCQVTDYTFIEESQIGIIFNALSSRGLKVNLMQNSAISFSFCLDFKEEKIMSLIQELGKDFEVYYNTGLTLITIKNYDEESFEKYRKQKDVVLEQSSRSTLQVLIRSQQSL
ncbi:MAG TPA: aspartate kinase [Cytophagales bacterium]|nr:aspartate kinase [Cytophagales bacterium]